MTENEKKNERNVMSGAEFISAPECYLSAPESMPSSVLPLGDWISPVQYTRYYLRREVFLEKPVAVAELEFQSSLPADIFLGDEEIGMQKQDGWYLTGVHNVTTAVRRGGNYLSVRGFLSDNPEHFIIGVRGCLKVTYTDGKTELFDTSDGFKNYGMCGFWENAETPGWQTTPLTEERAMNQSRLHPRLRVRAVYLKGEFETEKPVKKAVLYATAKGLYVPYLNGRRVSDARFLPGSAEGVTEYRAFDVTEFLLGGKNVLGAELGSGFYNSESWGSFYNRIPALMMRLEIEYRDGETYDFCTDKNWRVHASPRTENDIQFGERYDARQENGNPFAGAADETWGYAEERRFEEKPFAAQNYPPVRIKSVVSAKKMFTLADGSVCYDFGTNSSGRVKLTLKNTVRGERVLIRYCEETELSERGCEANVTEYGDVFFYGDTLATGRACYGARNIDVYICRGDAEETYIPEFTFTGFRYVYVSGYSGVYGKDAVQKAEMYSDLAQTGVFKAGHAGLERIFDAVMRSYRSNTVTAPTDCPTREKNFWNGDLQAFINTVCWYTDNNLFLERWTEAGRKMGGDDTYGWGDEDYVTPLTLYRFYENTDVVLSKYEKVRKLISVRKKQVAPGDVLPSVNTVTYGDHKAGKRVPDDFFCAAYYCRMFACAARMAEIAGKTQDAATYRDEFEKARKAFNAKYYLPEKHDYTPGNQGGIVYPVAFGIAEPQEIQSLADTLHGYVVADGYRFQTGFMSTEFIPGILCDNGYAADALKMMTNKEYPSLLNMIDTAGCGTTTESWEARVGRGDSLNHYAVGNATRWFFEYLGGIKPVKAGFEEIVIKPYFFKELKNAYVSYKSVRGTIVSAWEYNEEDDTFTWTVTIPEGIAARIELPHGMRRTGGAEIGAAQSGTMTTIVSEIS